MNLIVASLQRYLPELNKQVILPTRILEVFGEQAIEHYLINMRGAGASCYDTDTGRQYVFLNCTLRGILYQETLSYEAVHALCQHPAPFMKWRHEIEAEFIALVMMMPETDLPRLNRIKDQLDEESYEYLKRRNKGREIWKI